MNLVLKIILTSDFLLLIVIVTGGEELSKDESGHIDLLHLVLHHRNTLPIIPHTDGVVFTKGGNTHTHFHHVLLWLRLSYKLHARRHRGSLIGRAISNITHTSMLTLMQDMLLSLCLLSAAFTVGRIKQIASV